MAPGKHFPESTLMKRTLNSASDVKQIESKGFSPTFLMSTGKLMPSRLSMRSDLHIARKAWHMTMGVMIAALYWNGIERTTGVMILGSVLGLDLIMETLRLRVSSINDRVMKSLSLIMRSCEVNRLSGIPYYLLASLIAVAVFPKPIAVLSILYLACGDPIASLFGILYGHKSLRLASGKSLIGISAGIITCMAVTLVFASQLGLTEGQLAVITLFGGLAGGTAELLPLEVDDNFSIPVISGFALWMLFIITGV